LCRKFCYAGCDNVISYHRPDLVAAFHAKMSSIQTREINRVTPHRTTNVVAGDEIRLRIQSFAILIKKVE